MIVPCQRVSARVSAGLRTSIQDVGLGRSPLLLRTGLKGIACKAATAKPYFSTTDPKEQADIKRALEVVNQAADSWVLRYTDFYTPPTVTDILVNAKKLAGVEVFPWGGFQQAERCRLVVGKEELIAGAKLNLDEDGGVAALRVEGKFAFDSANHRDFLGACLGTGIERSRVGDILVQGEQGAQIMVAPELAEHLELNLVQVRSVSVSTTRIQLSELEVPEPNIQEFKTFEASLRLDSIASAGFKLSRGKLTDIIKSGDVRVNWKPAKAASSVKQGDVISCAGQGRVEVGEISETKKGRYCVNLVRFM